MAKPPDARRLELLQGTLDMLILRTLQSGPPHGHGIGQAIRMQSDDLLKVGDRAVDAKPAVRDRTLGSALSDSDDRVLGLVAVVATWIATRRAMRVDPAIVLRTE